MSYWIHVFVRVCQLRQKGLLAAVGEESPCWAALLPCKSSCHPSEKMSYLGWRPRTVSRLDNAAAHRRQDRPNKETSHLSADCKWQTDVSDLHCNLNWVTAPVFMHSLEERELRGGCSGAIPKPQTQDFTEMRRPMLFQCLALATAKKKVPTKLCTVHSKYIQIRTDTTRVCQEGVMLLDGRLIKIQAVFYY